MEKEKKLQVVAATVLIAILKQRTGDLAVFFHDLAEPGQP
jgi:hypothetical protein